MQLTTPMVLPSFSLESGHVAHSHYMGIIILHLEKKPAVSTRTWMVHEAVYITKGLKQMSYELVATVCC